VSTRDITSMRDVALDVFFSIWFIFNWLVQRFPAYKKTSFSSWEPVDAKRFLLTTLVVVTNDVKQGGKNLCYFSDEYCLNNVTLL
jgi:hypothetical protein